MSDKNDINKIFKCNICNKIYASNSSLWNHNNKFHKNNINQISTISKQISTNINQPSTNINPTSNIEAKKYECKNCNKQFNSIQARWKHNKKCIEIKTDNKSEFEEFKNTILELLQKHSKIHPKTLQKINKQLINNNINNGIINNGPVINNTFVKFGNEQLATLLSKKDMFAITNKICLCIEESIKTVHFIFFS